jgi:hypothetical protein
MRKGENDHQTGGHRNDPNREARKAIEVHKELGEGIEIQKRV